MEISATITDSKKQILKGIHLETLGDFRIITKIIYLKDLSLIVL